MAITTIQDFECKYRFHNELPPPEPFTGGNKTYPSRPYRRSSRAGRAMSLPSSAPIVSGHATSLPNSVSTVSGRSYSVDVCIVEGYIEEQHADVIVNSTTNSLDLSSGPLTKAVLQAAGNKIQTECRQSYPKGIATGEVAVTSGGDLTAKQGVKAIYHTTLPRWESDKPTREKAFKTLIRKCVTSVASENLKTIAIPLLGTGALQYPPERVLRWMTETIAGIRTRTQGFSARVIVHPNDNTRLQVTQIVHPPLPPPVSSKQVNQIVHPPVPPPVSSKIVPSAVSKRTDVTPVVGVAITSASSAPDSWTGELRMNLLLTSEESLEVISQLKTSLGSEIRIIQVERIQNKSLYKQYLIQKETMEEDNGRPDNELLLWHGTSSEAVPNINKNGFNRSYRGKHATVHGEGVYFARSSGYSLRFCHPDSHGMRYMYLAKVLTGIFTSGQRGMRDTPVRVAEKSLRYDSVVNDMNKPDIFVIFKDTNAYPMYLITFQTVT